MTEERAIYQAESPANLADRLNSLAEKIRETDGISLWKFLYELENDEVGFLEGVSLLEKYLAPASSDEEEARQMVQDAIRQSKEPHDWPEIEEDEFVITVDIECEPQEDNRPYLVLKSGAQELYCRPTWYGDTSHLERVIEDLRPVYRGRVKDVVLLPGVEDAMLMDSGRGGQIRRVLRPIRKDYQKRHLS